MKTIKELLFATMKANHETHKGDFTGEQFVEATRNLAKPAGGGVSSWNDLKDKPFYEEVTEVGGDTLTWDGNTEGLVSVNYQDFLAYYLISDAVPTFDDLANGYSLTINNKSITELDRKYVDELTGGGLYCYDATIAIAPYDNFEDVDSGSGMVFPKAGVYFTVLEGVPMVSSFTIPGYGGFEFKTVTPLDEKYMPILTSPSGKKFKLSVDDSGAVTATEV